MATKFNKQALLDRIDARIADCKAEKEAEAKAQPEVVAKSDAQILKDWRTALDAHVKAFVVKVETAFKSRSRDIDAYLRYDTGVYRGSHIHTGFQAPTAPEEREAERLRNARYIERQDDTTQGQLIRLNKQRQLLELMGVDKDGNVTITTNNHDFGSLLRDIID